jgi:hypothetical protein
MIKIISALAIAAALGVAAIPAAYAQETTNATTGTVVDGHGGGGSIVNRTHPDGPSGGFVTQTPDGTCYLHTSDKTLVIRCPANR